VEVSSVPLVWEIGSERFFRAIYVKRIHAGKARAGLARVKIGCCLRLA